MLLVRLRTLGFAGVTIAVDDVLRFTARKAGPAEAQRPSCQMKEDASS